MSAKQLSRRFFILFLLVMLVTGCTASAAEPPSAVPVIQMVDIGDYAIQLKCSGEGAPTVILEHGAGVPSMVMRGLQARVRTFTRVCSHERATDPPNAGKRSSQEFVNDLHALLAAAGVEGPYVLVGHEYGGMNVRLYADQYPDEVVGMVLVDSSHEDQLDVWAEILSDMTMKGVMAKLDSLSEDIPKSNEELAATGSLGDMPLAVLTAGERTEVYVSEETADTLQEAWLSLQEQLAGLSTNSTLTVVDDVDFVDILNRAAVSDAIRDVVEEVRAQGE